MAKRILWPVERIREGLERFRKKHGGYPTATEFDEYSYLPRTKTVERRFGGLVALRKQFGLDSEHDLRSGEHSSKRARTINTRAHTLEAKVYAFLIQRFGKEFVHREYFYTDDHRTRADFFIYDKHDGFCVDVFYANSLRNVTGCLNLKLAKYAHASLALPYPVIFLQMNGALDQAVLDRLVKRKKRGLGKKQSLMSWDTFQKFCTGRNPLRVIPAQD